MIEGWQVLTLALGYVGLLFAVAWFAYFRWAGRRES